jgi:hypothetical protein
MTDVMRRGYRELSGAEQAAVMVIKNAGADFLTIIDGYTAPSREQSLARTKVEEAVMWAVKSITA